MRSFENVDKDNTEEGLWINGCGLGFRQMIDTDIFGAATKQRRIRWVG
jgi:hypothetical protein